jgi:hypothetical protein
MSRLEIIHLRTAGKSSETLARQIRQAIGSEVDATEVVTIFRRNGLDTDVAVHITSHGSGEYKAGPSALGLHLESALAVYGLVEHTLWEEMT